MNPYLSNHALVAYMLVGAPMLALVVELLVQRVERRIRRRELARRAAMRRHPAGPPRCDACGSPVWAESVHADYCRPRVSMR